MDERSWMAIRLAFEAEAAFGVDLLPARGRGGAPVDSASTRGSSGWGDGEPAVAVATDALAIDRDAADSPVTPPTEPVAAPGSAPRHDASPAAPDDAEAVLADVAARIASCEACGLCDSRTRTVPGQGAARARLMFVGEAPGAEEDRQGLAFVGAAGQLLTRMIAAMGLKREDVFIANVLKCRPPENRDPTPEEKNACWHFLREQIDAVRPEVICALGAHAANALLERAEPMHRLRGRIFDLEGVKVVPTYHPSYLLRSPDKKAQTWADLRVVMKLLAT